MSFTRIKLNTPAALIATVGGIGNLPIAPGTWCSFVIAMPAVFLRPMYDEPVFYGYAIAAVLFSLGSLWSVPKIQKQYGTDPQAVVVDEAAGMSVALCFPLTTIAPLVILTVFLLFRLFDIIKPWPISMINNRTEGWAVLVDDILAGAFTVVAFYLLYPATMMVLLALAG